MMGLPITPKVAAKVGAKNLAILRDLDRTVGIGELAPTVRQSIAWEREKRAMRKSFAPFIKKTFETVDPGATLLWNWHLDAIADYLEACHRREIKRLIINIVPRYLKSISTSVAFPAWALGINPSEQFLAASFAESLAHKHSVDCRHVIRSSWYQETFPRVQIVRDQNEKSKFVTTERGHRIAVGFDGSATGEGGNFLLIDDPLNPKKAASQKERQTCNERFDQTFTTRLNDKKNGVIVVIMQRLHERDLTGHLMAQGGWEQLKLPGEFQKKTVISFHRPILIDEKPETERVCEMGEFLHPEREGQEEHEKARKALGSYGYAGQYLQEPAPDEGGLFKRYYLRFWKPKGRTDLLPVPVKKKDGSLFLCPVEELPESFSRIIQSWDLPFTKDQLVRTGGEDEHSYTVGGVWARHKACRYLLDLHRAHEEFPETLTALKTMTKRWPDAKAKVIEKKANGPALISTLKKEVPGIIGYEPRGDKYTRAFAHQPIFEAGNVYFPHPDLYPWVQDVIDELAMFPNAAHDDCVDMTSQALDYLDKAAEPQSGSPDWI